MRAPAVVRLVWLLAGVALVLGWTRGPLLDALPAPRALPRFDGATGQPWATGSFGAQTPPPAPRFAALERATSWVDSDDWQGSLETAWFKATRPTIYVNVIGYPSHPECSLVAEFRDAGGAITRVTCEVINPREDWSTWEIPRPAGATAVRLIATDRATGWGGWFGFSHPFRASPPALTAAFEFAQLFATTALALTLLWGPGLLWCSPHASPAHRLLCFLGAGPLLLALLGCAIWLLSGVVSAQTLGLLTVGPLWLLLGHQLRRRAFNLALPPAFTRVLALTTLVVLAVVAKSAHSRGPEGELFRGTISRNHELGDRIDSRFNYYTVQAAALHQAPAAPVTEKRFFPWTFFSRGPLAGLAAIPVVSAINAHPLETHPPDARFSPFDISGFAAFRVTLIVLSSAIIIALFLLLTVFVSEAWALVGAGLLALTPFGLHEIFFTWPKWSATAWLIASFTLAHTRRPFAAGLVLGVGFLYHPLALLWSPWIGLWAAGRAATQNSQPKTQNPSSNSKPQTLNSKLCGRALFRCAFAAGLVVFPWMAAGALTPHLPDTPLAGQGGFLRYWTLADWHPATWQTWWHTRWLNFANTFIPLHLPFDAASFDHPKLRSAYESSSPLAKLTQLWWTSLPFALGLGLWALSLVALVRAHRPLRAALWVFVLLPSLFMVAYWGMDPLGLMRECAHPLFVAILTLLVVCAAHHAPRCARVLAHRAVPWLQLPGAACVLWLLPLLNPRPWPTAYPHFDYAYLALGLLALLAAARLLARARRDLAPAAPSPFPFHSRLPIRIAYACALAALFLGPARFDRVIPDVLRPAVGGTERAPGPFTPEGVFPPGATQAVPPGVALYGSWPLTDAFVGEQSTAWFIARREFTLLLTGYPALAPNRLELQLVHRDHTRSVLAYTGPNPGAAWQPWHVTLPASAAYVRLRGVDASAALDGWLGFTAPFNDVSIIPRQLWPLLQLACTTALALVVLLGPGFLWLRQPPRTARDLLVAILIGPALLALLGLACWLLGGWITPATLARVGLAALLLALAFIARRQAPHAAPLPPHTAPLALVATLLVGFAVAKATLSLGPEGELFHGTVSRTLAASGHSDSRTSYHTVQLVAGHHAPFSAAAESLYSPWSFANRGPLGGLIAAPLVLATGGQPALDATHQPWEPFDRQGFATYRISQIVLAALAAFAVFGATAAILPVAWAWLAAVTLLLSPFFVHELYFTWPKLPTAAFALAAFAFAHARRPLAAAGLLAVSYLFHPLALFIAPFLALWLLRPGPLSTSPAPSLSIVRRLTSAFTFCAALFPVVAAWMLLGRLAPLRTGAQAVFFDFFRLANGALPDTPGPWWLSRWDNFANTFIPFHLFTVDRAEVSLNSVYGPSDAFVQASYLTWNTLPFALGLPACAFLFLGLAAACRRAFAVAAVLYLAPTVLMIFYWGAASTGLMRHCGHLIFVSTILLGIWGLHTHTSAPTRHAALNAFLHPATFALRAAEILLVAFGTTLLHQRPDPAGPFFYNDLLSLALAATLLPAAVFVLAKTTGSLRSSLS